MSKQWFEIREVQDFIEVVRMNSAGAFITLKWELIIEPKHNVYIILDNIVSPMDLKVKLLTWLSRPSCKGVNDTAQRLIRTIINVYLGTEFSKDDMRTIYAHLGCREDKQLCVKFIESGYDMSVLGEGIGDE